MEMHQSKPGDNTREGYTRHLVRSPLLEETPDRQFVFQIEAAAKRREQEAAAQMRASVTAAASAASPAAGAGVGTAAAGADTPAGTAASMGGTGTGAVAGDGAGAGAGAASGAGGGAGEGDADDNGSDGMDLLGLGGMGHSVDTLTLEEAKLFIADQAYMFGYDSIPDSWCETAAEHYLENVRHGAGVALLLKHMLLYSALPTSLHLTTSCHAQMKDEPVQNALMWLLHNMSALKWLDQTLEERVRVLHMWVRVTYWLRALTCACVYSCIFFTQEEGIRELEAEAQDLREEARAQSSSHARKALSVG